MATRITIAGDIGSGKTTVAHTVAQRLGVQALSTGGIQRQLASARGITTLELNKLAESDGSIDEQIDNYLKQLPGGDLVVESRMAWHFVPNTTRIFLYIVRQQAAQRILSAKRNDEPYNSVEDATSYIASRRRSEIHRFQKYYGVNIDDLRNYDLVIDTTYTSPDAVADSIMAQRDLKFRPTILLNPKDMVPTQGIRQLKPATVEEIQQSMKAAGFDCQEPIEALYVDHTFYIADGHNRAAGAIRAGLPNVPVRLAACQDEPYVGGIPARRYVRASVSDSQIYDWEDAAGFRYEHPIWRTESDARAIR